MEDSVIPAVRKQKVELERNREESPCVMLSENSRLQCDPKYGFKSERKMSSTG
jgi:hypothetical protein